MRILYVFLQAFIHEYLESKTTASLGTVVAGDTNRRSGIKKVKQTLLGIPLM